MMLALATMHGGVHSTKKDTFYYYGGQDIWMDEHSVDTTNASATRLIEDDGGWQFKSDWEILKYWLGDPLEPPQVETTTLASPNLIKNAGFDSSSTPLAWFANNG
jgi:hypothetical protein